MMQGELKELQHQQEQQLRREERNRREQQSQEALLHARIMQHLRDNPGRCKCPMPHQQQLLKASAEQRLFADWCGKELLEVRKEQEQMRNEKEQVCEELLELRQRLQQLQRQQDTERGLLHQYQKQTDLRLNTLLRLWRGW